MRAYRRAARVSVPAAEFEPGTETGPGEALALARYQPMFRLLAGEDADFLRHGGRCAKAAEQWQRSQRRIIRLYLKELASDFQFLHREARTLVARSPEQCAGMVPALFKIQFCFWRSLIWIEIRLSLRRFGLPGINPEGLRGAFEAMRQELSRGVELAAGRTA